MLAGFALIISSINILKRKQRALYFVAFFSVASIVFHLTKGIDYEEATISALLLAVLFFARREFRVKSADWDWTSNILRALLSASIVVVYGTIGFWLLETNEFNFNFRFFDAMRATLSIVSLVGDPGLVPQTEYAIWFTRSVYVLTFATVGYAILSLFRPVIYRFRTLPLARQRAARITERNGRSSMDFFKLWRDKTFFFTSDNRGFVAYRVSSGVALALGDPVGEVMEIQKIVREFTEFCREMGWEIAFYQTSADFLEIYRANGFRRLKIGEEAVIDLEAFLIESPKRKHLRKILHKFERRGYRMERFDAPVPDETVNRMREVSDDWLNISGRRERSFSLGQFDAGYMRESTIYAGVDPDGRILAFVNQIRDYVPGEMTFDLMRHRIDAPNGTMDFLFTNIILEAKKAGFQRLSMGMAALSHFLPNSSQSPEERTIGNFLSRVRFLFSYTGLQNFKAKFADIWEPRYLIYRKVYDLPQIGIALLRVSEIDPVSDELIFTDHGGAKKPPQRSWRGWPAAVFLSILALPCAYFLWYELHPRPLPPPGKNALVLRGAQQDIYFFPAVGGERPGTKKILFLPGDGGMGGLADEIPEKMAEAGYDVYALDTKRYLQGFTTESGVLTEPEVIDDLSEIGRWTDPRWGERITLVGWSEGAGLVVLAASAPNRAKLYNGIVILGLSDQAELGWRAADDITYITGGDPDEPTFDVRKYLPQVAPLPLAFVHSTGDQFVSGQTAQSQFELIKEPKRYFSVDADNHAFAGNTEGLFETLGECLDWVGTNAP